MQKQLEPKKSETSILKKIFIQVIILSSAVFLAAVIKYTKNCSCLTSCLFKDIKIDHTNPETYWIFIRKIAVQLALFIFAHSTLTMCLRIFTQKSSPSTHQDPTYIKLFNRILTNTVEQSFIFLALLTYFLLDGSAAKIEPNMILNIGAWFIWGRWIFSIGYILGTLIKLPQLRGYGFALTIFVNIFLIEHIFCPSAPMSNFFLNL